MKKRSGRGRGRSMVKQRAPLSFRRPIRFLRAAAPFVLLAGGAWFYTQHGGWQDQPRTRVSQATTIPLRSEEHTSELQSLMRLSYAVFCLKKKKQHRPHYDTSTQHIM